EAQPLGLDDGFDEPGSPFLVGDRTVNDRMGQIVVTGCTAGGNYNFGERPRVKGGNNSVSGYVWVDGNRNCVFDGGETPIPGVTITLTGTENNPDTGVGPVFRTTVTDATG